MERRRDQNGKRPVFDLNAYGSCENETDAWNVMMGWGEARNMEGGPTEASNQAEEDINIDRGAEFVDNPDDLEEVDVMSLKFNSIEDAECFYNNYAFAVGFSIRRGYKKNKIDGTWRYRSWLCSREGEREEKHKQREDRVREPKAVTRVGCSACMKIRLDVKDGRYVVSKFVKEHNHELATPASIPFMRSHRAVSDADYAQAYNLRRAGVRSSQIMKLFVLQAGGYQNVPFLIKDLYNKMNCENLKEIADGDAEGAMVYLRTKQDNEQNLFFDYCIDDEGRLSRLIWCDARSRADYACFGDVLVFDSTYSTNGYKMPLVVFCGVNNHHLTIVFACALVPDESEETYNWVLMKFLEAMGGKVPISVVTDGDKAMKRAIKRQMPAAKHRLCSWHLEKNAGQNIGMKEFTSAFKKCMFLNASPDEFEFHWATMVSKFRLDGNEWVKKMHRKKEQWAVAYLRGNFFAGMRSTQRSEKMNAVLKMYLVPKMKLYEFVRAHDLAISWLRHEEARNDALTLHTSLLPSTGLTQLEGHAADIYTRKAFLLVKKEMKNQGLYRRFDGVDNGVESVHLVAHAYWEMEWRVQYNKQSGEMYCSCMKMESMGLPCAHMFRIMVYEGLTAIPHNCVLKRWTRFAREGVEDAAHGQYFETVKTESARYARLVGASHIMCYMAAKDQEDFKRILDFMQKESDRMKATAMASSMAPQPILEVEESRAKEDGFRVLDPCVARTKGDRRSGVNAKAAKPHKKCGKCGSRDGHNKRTCTFSSQRNSQDEEYGPKDTDVECEEWYGEAGLSQLHSSRGFHATSSAATSIGRMQFNISSNEGCGHAVAEESQGLDSQNPLASYSQELLHSFSHSCGMQSSSTEVISEAGGDETVDW